MMWGNKLRGVAFAMMVTTSLSPISNTKARVGAVLAGASAAAGVGSVKWFTDHGRIQAASLAIGTGFLVWFLADAYLATYTPEGRLMEAERLIKGVADYQLFAHEVTNQEDLKALIDGFFSESVLPLAIIHEQLKGMTITIDFIYDIIANTAMECSDVGILNRFIALQQNTRAIESKIQKIVSYLEKIPGFEEQCEQFSTYPLIEERNA